MSRTSKKSSSFLDELLGSESLGGGDAGKRASAKSVRFIDNDDDDILGSLVPKPGSSTGRKSTASSDRTGLDWLENESSSPAARKPTSPSTPKTGRADWLGLGNDEEDDSVNDSRFLQSRTKPLEEDSFSSRRQKQPAENANVDSGTGRGAQDYSWLDVKKSMHEKIEPQNEEKPIIGPVAQSDVQSTGSAQAKSSITYEPQQSVLIGHVPTMATTANAVDSSHLLLLQTQVKVLELEKAHLLQTIEQLKNNREQEINVTKELHEQQLKMTKDFLTQQETMVSDEKEKRINDLKAKLDACELEKEEQRNTYNERMVVRQREWLDEIDRLKDFHIQSVKRLTEQHEEDISRIRRIKEQEIEAVSVLQSHGRTLDGLLAKWESSAQQIEELHKTIIQKQEDMLRDLTNIDNGLMVWQISAQEDAALSAEETAFVRRLQRAAGVTTTSKEYLTFN